MKKVTFSFSSRFVMFLFSSHFFFCHININVKKFARLDNWKASCMNLINTRRQQFKNIISRVKNKLQEETKRVLKVMAAVSKREMIPPAFQLHLPIKLTFVIAALELPSKCASLIVLCTMLKFFFSSYFFYQNRLFALLLPPCFLLAIYFYRVIEIPTGDGGKVVSSVT